MKKSAMEEEEKVLRREEFKRRLKQIQDMDPQLQYTTAQIEERRKQREHHRLIHQRLTMPENVYAAFRPNLGRINREEPVMYHYKLNSQNYLNSIQVAREEKKAQQEKIQNFQAEVFQEEKEPEKKSPVSQQPDQSKEPKELNDDGKSFLKLKPVVTQEKPEIKVPEPTFEEKKEGEKKGGLFSGSLSFGFDANPQQKKDVKSSEQNLLKKKESDPLNEPAPVAVQNPFSMFGSSKNRSQPLVFEESNSFSSNLNPQVQQGEVKSAFPQQKLLFLSGKLNNSSSGFLFNSKVNAKKDSQVKSPQVLCFTQPNPFQKRSQALQKQIITPQQSSQSQQPIQQSFIPFSQPTPKQTTPQQSQVVPQLQKPPKDKEVELKTAQTAPTQSQFGLLFKSPKIEVAIESPSKKKNEAIGPGGKKIDLPETHNFFSSQTQSNGSSNGQPLFGSSNANLFGFPSVQQLFGKPAESKDQKVSPFSSMFGGQNNNDTSSFGQNYLKKAGAEGGLFTQGNSGGSLFGNKNENSLFGKKSETPAQNASSIFQTQKQGEGQSLFGGSSQPSIFSQAGTTFVEPQEDENEEEGQEDDGPVEDVDKADPSLSTGKYDYVQSQILFKEAAVKFRHGHKDTLQNLIISLQKFDEQSSAHLFVRLANKVIAFDGTLLKDQTKVRILNGSSRNLEITKILIHESGKRAFTQVRVQLKDETIGNKLKEEIEKIVK